MRNLTINLIIKYPTLDEGWALSTFCCSIERLSQTVFEKYTAVLNLPGPQCGFLSEDCFTPWGEEECSPIIENSLNSIVLIGQKLVAIKHPDALISPKLKKFSNLQETRDYLDNRFGFLIREYKKHFPNAAELVFYEKLRRKFGTNSKHYFLAIENYVSGICNILFEFSSLFPEKKFDYFYSLGLLYEHLRSAGFNIRYRGTPLQSPIEIPYRDEGNGQGPFYDHYTLQRATGYPTLIGRTGITVRELSRTVEQNQYSLPYGDKKYSRKNIPPECWYPGEDKGLLVITGRARDTEQKRPEVYKERKEYETAAIKNALRTGRPILAICAGSWRLLEVCGGQTVDVKGHCNRSGMPRKIANGTIGYNMEVHRIQIEPTSFLAEAMGYIKSQEALAQNPNIRIQPAVNSVHWAAPSRRNFPGYLRVAASSLRDDQIAPELHKTGNQFEVEANTIEAFESQFGAPVFGIQWHPEAYEKNATGQPHHRLLKYCAQAGETYAARQRMLREYKVKLTDGQLIKRWGVIVNEKRRDQLAQVAVDDLQSKVAEMKIK